MLRKNQRRLLGQGTQPEANNVPPTLTSQSNSDNAGAQGQGGDTQLEILQLLQNISQQLTQLQAEANNVSPQLTPGVNQDQANSQSPVPLPTADQPQSTPDQLASQLQQVFKQLLSNNKAGAGQQGQGQSNPQGQKTSAGQGSSQTTAAKEQHAGGVDAAQLQKLTVQTASQVLSQAQYELANELEISLQKLKQVIRESEQIADKISNLLGEGNGGK